MLLLCDVTIVNIKSARAQSADEELAVCGKVVTFCVALRNLSARVVGNY